MIVHVKTCESVLFLKHISWPSAPQPYFQFRFWQQKKTCFLSLQGFTSPFKIRSILQGMVNKNLKLDRLARPNFLDPNHYNQPFDCTTFFLKVFNVHGTALHLFGAKAFPLSYYYCCASDIAAIGTTLKVLAMTWFGPNIEPITLSIPIRCVTCYDTDVFFSLAFTSPIICIKNMFVVRDQYEGNRK